jgi:hypothetical protein
MYPDISAKSRVRAQAARTRTLEGRFPYGMRTLRIYINNGPVHCLKITQDTSQETVEFRKT